MELLPSETKLASTTAAVFRELQNHMATHKMVGKPLGSSWLSKSTSRSTVQLIVHGVPFLLDRELLAARSSKLAVLFEKEDNGFPEASYCLSDIPADPETFELVARFCRGLEVHLSGENVVPVICIAFYLGMNENHSPNNLLRLAINFFQQRILPSWNETINVLKQSEKFLEPAAHLGLIDACFESVVASALADPHLLGMPLENINPESDKRDGDGDDHKSNARRKLFSVDWRSEDLTTLALKFYEPVIKAMLPRGVPSNFVAASLCRYVERWIPSPLEVEGWSVYERNHQREVIEAMERLLPKEQGLLPCAMLLQMLNHAVALEACPSCRDGFEARIGKQLDQATVEDLLVPFQGYAKQAEYDIGYVKRILKYFYNGYSLPDTSGLVKVAGLIEDFLTEMAGDSNLEIGSFMLLAEMSLAASSRNNLSSDAMYRAIDLYLENHRHLTEMEKEEVCRVLDCQRLSAGARKHAAQNERLPLRAVVQVLFDEQLKLRDTVEREFHLEENTRMGEGGDAEGEVKDVVKPGCNEEELRIEMERMSNKVVELEKECWVMRTELRNGGSGGSKTKKRKQSVWGEIKRKLGCGGSGSWDGNYQAKKKKAHQKPGEPF